MSALTTERAEAFWARVDRSGGEGACWPWTGCFNSSGYGWVRADGRSRNAHRVAWTLANGDIPEGMHVLHRCDNRPCCNPAHLWLGTIADNNADMVAKGRARYAFGDSNGSRAHPERRPRGKLPLARLARLTRGDSHPCAKLTAADVMDARTRHRSGGVSYSALAREYGVSYPTMRAAVTGESWSHV